MVRLPVVGGMSAIVIPSPVIDEATGVLFSDSVEGYRQTEALDCESKLRGTGFSANYKNVDGVYATV